MVKAVSIEINLAIKNPLSCQKVKAWAQATCWVKKKRPARDLLAAGVERAMGIEPTTAAWEAAVLPLNYARNQYEYYSTRLHKMQEVFCAGFFRWLDFLKKRLRFPRESGIMFWYGELSELVEGARLEIVCTANTVPRVRIPCSPPKH